MQPLAYGFKEIDRELMTRGVKQLRISVLLQIILVVIGIVMLALLVMLALPPGLITPFAPGPGPPSGPFAPEEIEMLMTWILGYIAVITIAGIAIIILALLSFIYLYKGWVNIAEADKEFGTQRTAVKLMLIALILIIVGIVLLIVGFATASGAPFMPEAGVEPDVSMMLGLMGGALIGILLLFIAGILMFIGEILVFYGFYKLGDEYDVSGLKLGGILLIISVIISIIPIISMITGILQFIGLIIVFAGLGTLKTRLERGEIPRYPAYQPPPPPPI